MLAISVSLGINMYDALHAAVKLANRCQRNCSGKYLPHAKYRIFKSSSVGSLQYSVSSVSQHHFSTTYKTCLNRRDRHPMTNAYTGEGRRMDRRPPDQS
jgi:hypothetical protein